MSLELYEQIEELHARIAGLECERDSVLRDYHRTAEQLQLVKQGIDLRNNVIGALRADKDRMAKALDEIRQVVQTCPARSVVETVYQLASDALDITKGE